MQNSKLLLVSLSVILLSILIFFLLNKRKEVKVIVGILSSRYNFEQRKAVRETYLEEASNKESIEAFFIVAGQDCLVPPKYRKNVFACDLQELNKSQIDDKLLTTHGVESGAFRSNEVFNGFSIKTHFEIVITKLGVLDCWFKSTSSNITVIVENGFTYELLATAVITRDSTSLSGYKYEHLEPNLVLPKGFVAIITLTESVIPDFCQNCTTLWKSTSALTDFIRVYGESLPASSRLWQANDVVATSMEYRVHNVEESLQHIRHFLKESAHYALNLAKSEMMLKEEIKLHQDIIVVDSLETYRNLPLKLLLFLNHICQTYDFKYFVKTDDDCFLNLKLLESHLHSFWIGQHSWWGNFRKHWAVNLYGKWEENTYEAPAYPPFACGSGYILTSDLAKWIAANKDILFQYQGEDVSVGIWLAAVAPNYLMDSRWQCTKNTTTIEDTLSVPNLNPNEMRSLNKKLYA